MPRQHNGHQPGRELIIGNAIVRGAFDEEIDFFAGKFAGVALLADDVNGTHGLRIEREASIPAELSQRRQ